MKLQNKPSTNYVDRTPYWNALLKEAMQQKIPYKAGVKNYYNLLGQPTGSPRSYALKRAVGDQLELDYLLMMLTQNPPLSMHREYQGGKPWTNDLYTPVYLRKPR